MNAIVATKYGSPEFLQLKVVEITSRAKDEVLLKVCASSVNTLDVANMKGPWIIRLVSGGLLKPRQTIPGADIARRVQMVGKDLKHLQPGLSLRQRLYQ